MDYLEYNGQAHEFKTESDAYDHFSMVCGLNKYTALVGKKINEYNENISMIGFSVGATAVWNNLSRSDAPNIKKAVCFYGSRIREKPTLKPFCNTIMIFPKDERHFSVPELSQHLQRTPNVRCINTNFYHGFMNKLSVNFDITGYAEHLALLNQNLP